MVWVSVWGNSLDPQTKLPAAWEILSKLQRDEDEGRHAEQLEPDSPPHLVSSLLRLLGLPVSIQNGDSQKYNNVLYFTA